MKTKLIIIAGIIIATISVLSFYAYPNIMDGVITDVSRNWWNVEPSYSIVFCDKNNEVVGKITFTDSLRFEGKADESAKTFIYYLGIHYSGYIDSLKGVIREYKTKDWEHEE